MKKRNSPLFPRTIKIIDDKFLSIKQSKIDPWGMFHSGKTMTITDCRGKAISYQGILFSGSPREVFWNNFIEPCIEDAVVEVFNFIVQQCKENYRLKAKSCMDEGTILLKEKISLIYQEMSRVDQRLRGKGFPNSVQPVDVSSKISTMCAYVDTHHRSSIDLIAASALPFYDKHKTLIWVAGLAIAIGGLIINIMKSK